MGTYLEYNTKKENSRAIKYILKCTYNANYNFLFKESKLLMFTDIINLEALNFSYTLINVLITESLDKHFNLENATNPHRYNARNSNYAGVKQHNKKCFNTSMFNRAVTEWLKVPLLIRNQATFKLFKKHCKTYLLDGAFN